MHRREGQDLFGGRLGRKEKGNSTRLYGASADDPVLNQKKLSIFAPARDHAGDRPDWLAAQRFSFKLTRSRYEADMTESSDSDNQKSGLKNAEIIIHLGRAA